MFCGSPNGGANNYCVGPSGTPYPDGSSQQDYETFKTGTLEPAIAAGWNGSSWTLQPVPPAPDPDEAS